MFSQCRCSLQATGGWYGGGETDKWLFAEALAAFLSMYASDAPHAGDQMRPGLLHSYDPSLAFP
jgi:hypothetical protein